MVGPLIAKDGTGLASLLPIGRFRIYTVTGDLPSRSRGRLPARRSTASSTSRSRCPTTSCVAMPPTELTRDFQCVTGWRVPEVEWKGVRLADLLDRAGVQAEATAVRFTPSTAPTPRASPSTRSST